MSLARVCARLYSGRRRAYVLFVVLALLIHVPLAHTSPPDPLWIAGAYDAADFDDVLLTITEQKSLVAGTPFSVIHFLFLAAVLLAIDPIGLEETRSSTAARAPPKTS